MSLADELWKKYQVTVTLDGKPIDVFVDKNRFLAAITEAMQAVRKRDAELCRETWVNSPNDRPEYRQNAISHGCIACAEAIERESLP